MQIEIRIANSIFAMGCKIVKLEKDQNFCAGLQMFALHLPTIPQQSQIRSLPLAQLYSASFNPPDSASATKFSMTLKRYDDTTAHHPTPELRNRKGSEQDHFSVGPKVSRSSVPAQILTPRPCFSLGSVAQHREVQ